MSEKLYPVARKEIARELDNRATPESLLAYPLLHDSDATGWRTWLSQVADITFRPRARDRRFEDYLVALTAAEQGLGIALARSLFNTNIGSRGLVRLHSFDAESPLKYYLLRRHGESRPAVAAICERILSSSK